MRGSGEIISTDPGGSSIIIIYIEEGFYHYKGRVRRYIKRGKV